MPDDLSNVRPIDAERLAATVAEARQIIASVEANAAAPRVGDPLDLWRGSFGDCYADRCAPSEAEIAARADQWRQIIRHMDLSLTPAVAEVGANQGQNLEAIHRILPMAGLFGVEPNEKARSRIKFGMALDGTAQKVPLDSASVDVAFTSGVLIHIHPDELLRACSEIVRISKRYVVAVEYFHATPTELIYRGHGGALWKRDFGGFYLDNFPTLKPIAAGFSWKRLTGLDDVHWWLLEKPQTEMRYDIAKDEMVPVTKRPSLGAAA